jgi:hypothetical protein
MLYYGGNYTDIFTNTNPTYYNNKDLTWKGIGNILNIKKIYVDYHSIVNNKITDNSQPIVKGQTAIEMHCIIAITNTNEVYFTYINYKNPMYSSNIIMATWTKQPIIATNLAFSNNKVYYIDLNGDLQYIPTFIK